MKRRRNSVPLLDKLEDERRIASNLSRQKAIEIPFSIAPSFIKIKQEFILKVCMKRLFYENCENAI